MTRRQLFHWKEPVDVTALRAHVAVGPGSGPLQVKERRYRTMQLRVPVMKLIELADLAAQVDAGDDSAFRFGLVE